MQKVFATPVDKSTKLNCTANDIRLSEAVSWAPATCTKGGHFDLTAKFRLNVTASGRYDAGIFFRTDGGPNARGDGPEATGTCSLSALDPDVLPDPTPVLNLDGDSCGDLNAGTQFVTLMIPDVLCEDSDGDGELNLPYCTSWHSNQGTWCDLDGNDNLLFEQNDHLNFDPDTKSKCVCDDGFGVPVEVEDAALTVEKTPSTSSVEEAGGLVTFTVKITNDSQFESVIIDSILDTVYLDLLAPTDAVVANTCDELIGVEFEPGAFDECTFTALVSALNTPKPPHVNLVEVCGTQTGKDATVCASDDAVVDITNTPAKPTITKSVEGCPLTQMDATYGVTVANPSTFDVLTIDGLTDDKFGVITAPHAAGGGYGQVVSTTCAAGTMIEPNDPPYTCSFVGRITSDSCDITHTNTVKVTTTDDDVQSATESNPVTVGAKVILAP